MRDQMVRTEALKFTVHVVVDPRAITSTLTTYDSRSFETVVADEITSNLESVPYVQSVTVLNKTLNQGDST